jgi:histidinol-phosphate aminotransferase
VLRTFSKIYGLAGLRVGYGVGPAELVTAIAKVRRAFDVNSFAQVAALASLD